MLSKLCKYVWAAEFKTPARKMFYVFFSTNAAPKKCSCPLVFQNIKPTKYFCITEEQPKTVNFDMIM
jgi:hypothetical protein